MNENEIMNFMLFEVELKKIRVLRIIGWKLNLNFGRVSPIILTNQKPANSFKSIYKSSKTILIIN